MAFDFRKLRHDVKERFSKKTATWSKIRKSFPTEGQEYGYYQNNYKKSVRSNHTNSEELMEEYPHLFEELEKVSLDRTG